MAESRLNVLVGAKIEGLTKGLKKAQRSMRKWSRSTERMGKSLSTSLTLPMAAFGAASLKAFDVQAKAEAGLFTALKGNEQAFQRLTKQAQEFQKVSLFSDEEIIQQQSYLASLGMTEEQINKVISASIDLAAGTGQTLEFGVKNLAKTFAGLTGELGESIPALKELTTEQLKAGEAVGVIAEQFEGRGIAAAKSGAGAYQQLGMAIGDFTEQVGEALLPLMEPLREKLESLTTFLSSLTKEQIENGIQFGLFIAAIGPALIIISKLITGISGISTAFMFLSATVLPAAITAFTSLFALLQANPLYRIAAGIALLGIGLVAMITSEEEAADTTEELSDEQKELNRILEEAKKRADDYNSSLEDTQTELQTTTTKTKELTTASSDYAVLLPSIAEQWGLTFNPINKGISKITESTRTMGQVMFEQLDGIVDAAMTTKDSFKVFAGQVIQQMVRMIAKAAILAALLSVIFPKSASGGASFMKNFGNLMKGGGMFEGKAVGGFASAGTPYLVGEHGPELFTPSGSSGGHISSASQTANMMNIPDVRISGEDLLIVFDRANKHRNSLG
tara:strand:+ start:9105 stop:10796 length:1692 start_codon:yes stop_codon:yes gene_type:complete